MAGAGALWWITSTKAPSQLFVRGIISEVSFHFFFTASWSYLFVRVTECSYGEGNRNPLHVTCDAVTFTVTVVECVLGM